MNDWIKTSEKQPADNQRVIAYTHTGAKRFMTFKAKDELFYAPEFGYSNCSMVSHWMPEPKDPEILQYKTLKGNVIAPK